MASQTPELMQAIEAALSQVRAELIRFHIDNDIGKIEVNCGKGRYLVKALPERINDPVKFVSTE